MKNNMRKLLIGMLLVCLSVSNRTGVSATGDPDVIITKDDGSESASADTETSDYEISYDDKTEEESSTGSMVISSDDASTEDTEEEKTDSGSEETSSDQATSSSDATVVISSDEASTEKEEETKGLTVSASGFSGSYAMQAEEITDSSQIGDIRSFLDNRSVLYAMDITPVNASIKDPDKGVAVTVTLDGDDVPDADEIANCGLYHLVDYTLSDTRSNGKSVYPKSSDINTNASYEKLDFTYNPDTKKLSFTTKSFSPFVLAKLTKSEKKTVLSDSSSDSASSESSESSAASSTASGSSKAKKTDGSEIFDC